MCFDVEGRSSPDTEENVLVRQVFICQIAVIILLLAAEPCAMTRIDVEDKPMTAGIVEQVVFGDGPAVETVGYLLARLGKIICGEGCERWMFCSNCIPFETLYGEKYGMRSKLYNGERSCLLLVLLSPPLPPSEHLAQPRYSFVVRHG